MVPLTSRATSKYQTKQPSSIIVLVSKLARPKRRAAAIYMGKVGTGWSRTVSSQVRKRLDTVVSSQSKLTKQVKKPRATWVEPKC